MGSLRNILWLVPILLGSPLSAQQEGRLKVIRTIPHSGYSEGVDFHEGFLWHALPKEIVKIDPATGSVVAKYLPATTYSESVVWFKGALWNVSYSDNGIYSGVLQKTGEVRYQRRGSVPEAHAWGLTHDGKHLIVTGNYSNKLYFLNPQSLKVERTIATSIKDLEDLAWDGKGIWTSSFTQHKGRIFRVDPATGAVSRLFSLPEPEECPVIDGIAFDGKNLWVTGKHCTSFYYIAKPSEAEIRGESPAAAKAASKEKLPAPGGRAGSAGKTSSQPKAPDPGKGEK